MIKDIVVNLGLGPNDPAGDYAVSMAEIFEAHLLAVAVSYDPIIPGTVMGGIPPEIIEGQRRESDKKRAPRCARFEQAAKRAGISVRDPRHKRKLPRRGGSRSDASAGASI